MFRPTWTCGLILLLGVPLPAQETNSSHDPRLFQSPEQQRTLAAGLEKLLAPDQGLSTAQRQYQAAKSQNPKDPRSDYAMGLVLLNRYDYDGAGQLFQAATQGDRIHYLPAWQAVIHLDLLQKDRERFLRDTLELAKLAANPQTEWIGKDQALAAAGWLGEVFEYLKLPRVDFLEPDQLTAHAEKLTELMTPELVGAWVDGQPKLRQKYARVFNETRQQQQQAKAEIEHTANRKTAELTDRKQDLDEKQEDVRKSTQEWKAWHDKQMKQTQTQLKTLQRDFAMLDAAARRLNGIMTQLQLEVGQLQTLVQLERNQQRANQRGLPPSRDQLLLAQRQQEFLRHQLQYAALEQKALSLMAQARQVVAVQQQAASKYKNATGQIGRRNQTLDRWKKVVENSSLKAAAKAQDTDPLEALEKRRTMVASYFPLDFDTEKERLLKSYELP